jgi:hypothetical protein
VACDADHGVVGTFGGCWDTADSIRERGVRMDLRVVVAVD